MKLKAILETLEGLPEAFHALYELRDGKYMLTGVEGMVTEADVARATRALNQEKEQHRETKAKLKSFGDLKPSEVSEQLEELRTMKEKGVTDEDRINTLADQRARRLTAEVQRQLDTTGKTLAERESELTAIRNQLQGRELEDVVRSEIKNIKGLQPEVVTDAIILARSQLTRAEDGVFVDSNGISVKDWLIKSAEARPYWYMPSNGGGANGGRGGNQTANPFTAQNWNVTEQGKLMVSDPTKYEALARAAGVDPAAPRKPVAK